MSVQAETTDELPGRYKRPYGYMHHRKTDLNNARWMSHLADSTKLSQLNLIGTHETLAFHGGDAVKCQSLPLKTQMIAGIRVLDIRCNQHDDDFYIHHGFVSQRAMFADILKIIVDFLKENPTETIYMRVKHEYKKKNNKKSFEEVFLERIEPYKDYFWQVDNSSNSTDPPLSETRGKIGLLQQFTADKTYGIQWYSSPVKIQDKYHFKKNWQQYTKWESIFLLIPMKEISSLTFFLDLDFPSHISLLAANLVHKPLLHDC